MVTGDSKETAIAIAKRCGILGGTGSSSTAAAIGEPKMATIGPTRSSVTAEESSEEEYLDLDAYTTSMDDIEYGSCALSGSQLDAIGHDIMQHIAALLPPEEHGVYAADPALRAAAEAVANHPWYAESEF